MSSSIPPKPDLLFTFSSTVFQATLNPKGKFDAFGIASTQVFKERAETCITFQTSYPEFEKKPGRSLLSCMEKAIGENDSAKAVSWLSMNLRGKKGLTEYERGNFIKMPKGTLISNKPNKTYQFPLVKFITLYEGSPKDLGITTEDQSNLLKTVHKVAAIHFPNATIIRKSHLLMLKAPPELKKD